MKSPKRTIFVSREFEALQMISERDTRRCVSLLAVSRRGVDTRRCASKKTLGPRGVDLGAVPYRLEKGKSATKTLEPEGWGGEQITIYKSVENLRTICAGESGG